MTIQNWNRAFFYSKKHRWINLTKAKSKDTIKMMRRLNTCDMMNRYIWLRKIGNNCGSIRLRNKCMYFINSFVIMERIIIHFVRNLRGLKLIMLSMHTSHDHKLKGYETSGKLDHKTIY